MEVNNYMIYGLVEIGLLVIGILIALQINNWNESRKEKQLEIQLFEAIINDLDLKRNELISDLDAGMKMIQKSDKIIHTWHNESRIDSTEIKYMLKLMGDDSWFHEINSPAYTGLSNSDLWKLLPVSIINQIDDIYRTNLPRVKVLFQKSGEYATYCKLNFLAPNNLLDLDKSSEEIVELLKGKEDDFISYLRLFRNGVFRLNERFEQSTTSIEKVINNLESYKNTVPEIL
jgi:hypothetical protein